MGIHLLFPMLMAVLCLFSPDRGDLRFVDDDNITGPWDGSPDHPFKTIQAGIDACSHQDVVRVMPGTYHENLLFNGKAIIVQGAQGPEYTVIDGGLPADPDQGSVATFKDGEDPDTVLEGFTLQNGRGTKVAGVQLYQGGGIYCLHSAPTIRNNVIIGNTVYPGHGGGIYVDSGSPAIRGNRILANSASGQMYLGGAGIFIVMNDAISGTLRVEENLIAENNTGEYGGGLYVEGTEGNPHWPELVIIENNTISGNQAQFGGGIYCHNYAAPAIRRNRIRENSAIIGAGGIGVTFHADPLIESNLIISNDGDVEEKGSPGGGIRLDNYCSASILNNIIAGNRAGTGGGIHVWYINSAEVINNTITGNIALGKGGAISMYGGWQLNVANTIIWDNPANSDKEIYITAGRIDFLHCDLRGGQAAVYAYHPAGCGWGAGMIDADPLFLNPAGMDFHLGGGSPCIDKAAFSPFSYPLPSTDIDGDPRCFAPDGKGLNLPHQFSLDPMVDIGADEFCRFITKIPVPF